MSGHDQFFATFSRFQTAALGRFGDMVAEARQRAGQQNMLYLELMISLGMLDVIGLAASSGRLTRRLASALTTPKSMRS